MAQGATARTIAVTSLAGRWVIGWAIALGLAALLAGCGGGSDPVSEPPRVLLVIAHPDDETLFNLGRFTERGWRVSVALVTNGENGSVVQGIRPVYDPADEDILIERSPGAGTWLTVPPGGPRLREIRTARELAAERRAEFLASLARHRVAAVFFFSDLDRADFEDSWDRGITRWDRDALAARIVQAVRYTAPDLIVTLNPAETWAHPQHFGLGRIVQAMLDTGRLDLAGARRPTLYGLREHGWYEQSLALQDGDLRFARTEYSSVLGAAYEDHWRTATSLYISQSSHPVWLDARVRAGILPGYASGDRIRRIDHDPAHPDLDAWFATSLPDATAHARLPGQPEIVDPGR